MAHAGWSLVATLEAHGVERVFCVPGESYLPVLDALRDSPIDTVVCRHEATAAHMAEAHGKLTGRPGVCLVTRGPGATQASIGVHTARQDSTPMILFVGQVAREDRGKEAFQEVDLAAMFAPLAKWAVEADDPARLPDLVARAFATATQGRPGPVVISLPEDVLRAAGPPPAPPRSAPQAAFAAEDAALIVDDLAGASRPLAVLGGSGWSAAAVAAWAAFAARWSLPTALSFRRKDLMDNDHPCYVGDLGLGPNPDLVAYAKAADVVLAIGPRLGENPTQGYTLWRPDETARTLRHVHPDPQELNRVWPARRAFAAGPAAVVAALAAQPGPASAPVWAEKTAAARASYGAFSAPIPAAGAVNLSEVMAHLAQALPADAIVCNGAGNYAAWLHRFFRHRGFRTQLAPTSGAMGYGLPAAIAAKLAHPGREVVALAGDGCFQMAAHELATAVERGANVVVIVCDNGAYGTIRMHQEREFPGRVHATGLRNPDFAALARACGAMAATVARTADFPAALADARAAGAPALIHLSTSLADIAPGRRLDLADAV